MWSTEWSIQNYHPQKVRLNLQSQLLRQQDSGSHLHWQLLSHLSINEFSFLHSEWKFPPFPAQRQCNWDRKNNHSKQRVKSKWLNFGDGFANKSDRLTIWHQTPQPIWKRKVKCPMSVILRLHSEMRVETGDLKTQRSFSSWAENTR